MKKANKTSKNKVPKINEEEYAAYIAHLKEEPNLSTEPLQEREDTDFVGVKNQTKYENGGVNSPVFT